MTSSSLIVIQRGCSSGPVSVVAVHPEEALLRPRAQGQVVHGHLPSAVAAAVLGAVAVLAVGEAAAAALRLAVGVAVEAGREGGRGAGVALGCTQ